jgi:hypothetical protein
VFKIGVIATNVFERNELNQWLLIHHHGSSVTNYIAHPATVNSYVAAIRHFYEMNDIVELNWKKML